MSEDWGKRHERAKDELDYKRPDVSIEGELSEAQTEAILNMRLRSLRKLEEVELVKERDSLMEERANLEDLLADTMQQWNKIAEEIRETKKQFGQSFVAGARRTDFAEAQDFEEVPIEAMIEKEPITVVCSSMGWIRAMNGHIDLERELKFKDGDGPGIIFHAQTTDKLLALGSNGRFYTILASNLPGGRGMGEPIRLMVDIPDDAKVVTIIPYISNQKLLVASSAGDGFIVRHDDVIAQTKSGKQVLNVKDNSTAKVCCNINGDHIAVVGENRKVLIFPISELPEMARGKGVRLQKYKDGGLSDLTTFNLSDGLTWLDPAGRTRTESNLADWMAKRASAGRMAPRGFPRIINLSNIYIRKNILQSCFSLHFIHSAAILLLTCLSASKIISAILLQSSTLSRAGSRTSHAFINIPRVFGKLNLSGKKSQFQKALALSFELPKT